MNGLKPILARLAAGERLAESEAEAAFGIIMAGDATPAQIAGMLMAMRVRGETVAEMTGAVRAMRARMLGVEVPPDAMDVVGTGGDASGSLNISTTAAMVVAGAGVPVAKHGNRALSSKSGAADASAPFIRGMAASPKAGPKDHAGSARTRSTPPGKGDSPKLRFALGEDPCGSSC